MKRTIGLLVLFLFLSVEICADEEQDSVVNITTDTIIYLDESALEVEDKTYYENEDPIVETTNKQKEKKQVFYGFSAHMDVASTLISLAVDKGTVLTFEGAVDVDLLHTFFPIFEVGFTHVNKSMGEVEYYVAAPFYRVGMNYNFFGRKRKKTDEDKPFIGCYPYIGLRYGFTLMRYHLDGVSVSNGYWTGEAFPSRLMQTEQKYVYGGWAEVVGGVRVNMAKGFTMGWTARVGLLSHSSKKSRAQIWYLPGFGKNNSVNFGFNYTFGYTLNYDKLEHKEHKEK